MSSDDQKREQSHPLAALDEISRLRQRPVLLLCGNSTFFSDTATMLYTFLRQLGPQKELDIVFQSPGGNPIHARRLAVLLREFTEHLSIFVLQQAHSAGTLFCLAADEVIMSPLSTLGPIDPQVSGQLSGGQERTGSSGPDKGNFLVRSITTEEVRLFRTMATAWFGVGETVEEHLSLLHTFSNRFFPTTLTALFRADQEMRRAANEMLCYHQSDARARQHICDQFVGGFFSHGHSIHRQEAREIGLNIANATDEEETCLWNLLNWWQAYQGRTYPNPDAPEQSLRIESVLVGNGFAAQEVRPVVSAAARFQPGEEGESRLFPPSVPSHQFKYGWQQIPLNKLALD